MNWLENLLTPTLVRAVGYTILHSLWQGAVVALALGGLMLVLRRHSAQVRYRVTAVALGLLLLLAGVTFLRYYWTGLPAAAPADLSAVATESVELAAPVAAVEGPLSTKTVLRYVEHHLPLLVALWFLGLLTMTLRLLGGLAYVQRLRHYGTRPLGLLWQNRLNALAERVGLDKSVALMESSLVRVPVVVGHLRPIILLPLGAVAGLSALQLEAILAHELAHVVRRDYLINLLQSVAEILFFYHPAVWFLTTTLRSERENCCDDVAASLCGDPLVLARALAALAELGLERAVAPRLTMAAVGPKGSLLTRVRRLVQGRTAPTFTEGFMAACVVIVGLMMLSFTAAAALANPRLTAEAPRLLRNTVLKPFLREVVQPEEVCADEPVVPASWEVPVRPELVPAAPADDDDDKRKRKNKRKDTSNQVVVVDGNGRRGNPSTVVIEKDKKGRVTELYVNGQRVETNAADGRGGKAGKDVSTQIIRVPLDTYARLEPGDFKFDYKYDQKFNEAEFRKQFKALDLNAQQLVRLKTLGHSSHWQDVQRQALADAEKSLLKARLDRDLSEDERDKIEDALDRIHDQRDELRDRDEEMRERDNDARARLNEERARRNEELARRSEERARQNEERARVNEERAREREERAREREERARRIEEQFVAELRSEGLIKDEKNFELQLSESKMTVNGVEQPESVRRKYLDRWASANGRGLGATGKLSIGRSSNNSHTWISDNGGSNVAPPLPPAAPRAPRAGVAPVPPAPPRAPRAPRLRTTMVNGVNLADELRKDGLIGEADRSFQFRLNGSEMVVNGKKQPAATADRYRKLMGGEKGGKVNMDIVVNAD
ncbi:M56 family metallopeptidase [Hymenobacter sp. CRA2]|uniref:M56 family metallopeptidase n=1 Tax=Hymenobacter sp. CRA2 TaxID=1955620 RepID=UPI00098E9112|nr:M56 family metallopeptidase [Hymenobacter sp. CRA2]OON69059.1 hypothetical protein B0919_10130 [Hymenobacter sp. CRA2]